jgi:Protein-disulfide isomerase
MITSILTGLLAVFFSAAMANSVTKPAAFTKEQTKELEEVIHNYLLNNPGVLFEMEAKLREKEIAARKERLKKVEEALTKYKDNLFGEKESVNRLVTGNPKGNVVLVEFTQHQCPACKQSAVVVEEVVKENSSIRNVTIFWPFLGKDAAFSAKAVLAAKEQHRGGELNELLFKAKGPIDRDKVTEIAKSISGLDLDKLLKELESLAIEKELAANFKLAGDLGLSGTPTLIVANKELTKFSLVSDQAGDLKAGLLAAIAKVTEK